MLHKISFILLIIGGLNWGLEAFHTGLGHWLSGSWTIVMIIYILVGLAALYEVFTHKARCKNCEMKGSMQGGM